MLTTGLIMALGLYIPFSSFGEMIGLQPLPIEYFPWLAHISQLLCCSSTNEAILY